MKTADHRDVGNACREVLLVGTDPANIQLTREALEALELEHRLQVAEDGIAALKYLTQVVADRLSRQPDLVLLDADISRMSGLEVLAVIKSDEQMKSIPVVLMSSSASDDDAADACRLNANGIAHKPLESDSFMEVIRTVGRFWLDSVLKPDGPAGKPH
ncbi:response regulator [Elongatibacter sediminis]|uniref:response regulator n=1 Tax=Elongatibacter sediminis TaxID=3119006 RepID=UPI00339D4D87